MSELCETLHIDEVVLSTHVSQQRLRDLVRACELAGVPVKRIKMELQRIADTELGWVLPSPDAEVPAAAIITSQPSPLLPIERPSMHVVPAQARLNDH